MSCHYFQTVAMRFYVSISYLESLEKKVQGIILNAMVRMKIRIKYQNGKLRMFMVLKCKRSLYLLNSTVYILE